MMSIVEDASVFVRRAGSSVIKRYRSTVTATADQLHNQEWANAKPYSAIPGPKPLPIPLFGNFWRMIPKIGTYGDMSISDMHNKLQEDYGNIVKLSGMGRHDIIMLYNAEDVQKVYRTEGTWPIRPGADSLTYYRTVHRKDVYKDWKGVAVTQGEEWQKNRTTINQPMMKPANVMKYVDPIQIVTDDFLERIKLLLDDNKETPANFVNELHKWALESIGFVVLDTRLGCLNKDLKPDSDAQNLINAVTEMFYLMYKLDVLPSLWKYYSTTNFKKMMNSMDTIARITQKHIERKLDEIKARPDDGSAGQCLLEILLKRDGGLPIAKTMAMDMLTAGIDTSGYSVGIAMYYLAKNREVQEKLYQELKTLLPSRKDKLPLDFADSAPYLKACIKESQRLTPIVGANFRKSHQDLIFNGYKLPKGTIFGLMHGVMSRKEEHFPNADKYIPERWLKNTDAAISAKSAHPFAFHPFGYGPRTCIGRRFAEMEMQVLISKLIRNFQISYNYGEMIWKSDVFVYPGKPLRFQMIERPN